jgi:hypothetical protein
MLLYGPGKLNVGVALALLVLTVVPPCPPVRAADAVPIGRLATSGQVAIGTASAPTGTAIFSGDRLAASDAPALVTLPGGSSVSLTPGASATFSRDGSAVFVKAEAGTIGFRFLPRQQARMQAGPYQFTPSAPDRPNAGELTVGADGQVIMALSSGSLSAVDTATGKPFDVSATPQGPPRTPPTGTGTLVNDSNTLSDAAHRWPENALRGKCVVARGEAHRIVANKANTLEIAGTWLLFSGKYDYTITECTAAALDNAGAAIGVDEALQPPSAAPQAAAAPAARRGMSGGAKAGLALVLAGGAGAGAAIAVSSSRKSKSP